jgi:RHS repeat-associated protein
MQVGGIWARTGLPELVSSTNYDAANRLLSWSGNTFSYDLNGNLASDGLTSYVWDARNQLTALSGGTSASFGYDGVRRRRSKTIGSATNFLYDGDILVQELTSSGMPTANNLTGLGIDENFARTDSNGTNTFLADALGSTIALADVSGIAQTSYTFEPFGVTTASGAPNANDMQFTGRENDGIGMYYYRSRFYTPQVSRFISEDAFEYTDTINLYTPVRNNPVNFIDPFGYQALPACTNYRVLGNVGYITIRTEPVTTTLAWGAYMYVPMWNWGDWWTEEYINGKMVNAKHQNYPPHGSQRVCKGDVFTLKVQHVFSSLPFLFRGATGITSCLVI